MRCHPFLHFVVAAIFFTACSDPPGSKGVGGAAESAESTESEDTDDDQETDPEPTEERIEIVAGVGIGPAQLGGTYGDLVADFGPPDSSFEYYRVIFAVWLELGIEVVFSAGISAELADDDPIISVGTKLRDGYYGTVIPGMSRAEAEAQIGPCTDVVDGVHCYHPIGLYLGFDADENIQTVAIHPPYTVRSEPPAMQMSDAVTFRSGGTYEDERVETDSRPSLSAAEANALLMFGTTNRGGVR